MAQDGDASAPETPLLRPLLRHSETMKGYADYGDELTNPAHFQWSSNPVDAVEEWEEDVEEPLLAAEGGGPPRQESVHRHAPPPPPPEHPNSLTATVLNLSKVILGSGMLVLPRVFQLLGVGLAVVLLTAIGAGTWFTVAGLVYAAERTNKHSYAAVMRFTCGRPAKWGLLAAVFANCAGMCVVFMVVFSDILLGTGADDGLITELFPSLSPTTTPWLNRPMVLATVTLLLLTPLAVQRDLARLGPLALAGMASVGLFALTTVVLAGAALAKGQATPLPWLPDWDGLAAGGDGKGAGSGGGGSASGGSGGGYWAAVGVGIAAVMPLVLNADICHQSVFPAMSLLVPYTRKRFILAAAGALALCNVLYLVIALCCMAAFGTQLESNVLNNMSMGSMAPLIGTYAAGTLALLVRTTYFISTLGSFVFTLHPLRICCLEVLLGSNFPTKKQHKADRLFLPLTLVLLLVTYVLAVTSSGIWVVLSLVGSSASTFMGFVFPACIILVVCDKTKWQHKVKKTGAVAVAAVGIVLFVNGLVTQFYSSSSSSPSNAQP